MLPIRDRERVRQLPQPWHWLNLLQDMKLHSSLQSIRHSLTGTGISPAHLTQSVISAGESSAPTHVTSENMTERENMLNNSFSVLSRMTFLTDFLFCLNYPLNTVAHQCTIQRNLHNRMHRTNFVVLRLVSVVLGLVSVVLRLILLYCTLLYFSLGWTDIFHPGLFLDGTTAMLIVFICFSVSATGLTSHN